MVNKIELIDKAIKDLGGDISKANNGENIKYRYVWKNSLGYNIAAEGSIVHNKGEYFCTIEEFEQRKKERELMNWYDYENQKMLKSPPVGEIVLVRMDSGKEYKAKVLEITHNTDREIFIVRVFNGLVEGVGDLVYKDKAKPLDWDKLSKRKQVVNKALDVFAQGLSDKDGMLALYDAGYLKLPENNA